MIDIEELRRLLGKATPSLLAASGSTIAKLIRAGAERQKPRAKDFEDINFDLDGLLISQALKTLPALLDRVEAGEWRPIETAPKDGTVIDLFGLLRWYQDDRASPPSHEHRAVNCFWDDRRW